MTGYALTFVEDALGDALVVEGGEALRELSMAVVFAVWLAVLARRLATASYCRLLWLVLVLLQFGAAKLCRPRSSIDPL